MRGKIVKVKERMRNILELSDWVHGEYFNESRYVKKRS
jgi:hypothetical protein